MTLIVDAAPLVALADRDDPTQPDVETILRGHRGPLVVPAPVTAEVDHLLGVRVGEAARHAFLEDLAAGRFEVACLDRDDRALALELDERYRDLRLSLADLSVIIAAWRHDTLELVTFDERDFRAVAPVQGGSFVLLPCDRDA